MGASFLPLVLEEVHELVNLLVVEEIVGEPAIEFLFEKRGVVLFLAAHLVHELAVDQRAAAFHAGHGLVVDLPKGVGAPSSGVAPDERLRRSRDSPEGPNNKVDDRRTIAYHGRGN